MFCDKSETNLAKFRNCLNEVNWHNLEGFDDPTNSYASFLSKYNDLYNSCFPLKRVKVKKYNLQKPWLSKGLLKSIKWKNKLYKSFVNTPTYVNDACYKKYKNKLYNYSIRNAKRLYYEKKLENFKLNSKSMWRILNEVINKKKCSGKLPKSFTVDNHEISNPIEIADQFCDYFTNVGPSLARKIPSSTLSFRSFLSGNYPNSIFLNR